MLATSDCGELMSLYGEYVRMTGTSCFVSPVSGSTGQISSPNSVGDSVSPPFAAGSVYSVST